MCRGLRITQPVAGILRTLRNRLEEVHPHARLPFEHNHEALSSPIKF